MAITFNHNDQVYVKDGKLGIGTDNPGAKIHVLNGNIQIQNETQGGDALILFDNNYTQEWAIGMTNTAGPVRDFVIYETSTGSSTDATNPRYIFNGNGDGIFQITDAADGDINVSLNTNGDSYLNGGNVGIGTNSPSDKLDVSGQITQIGSGDYHWVTCTARFSEGGVTLSRSGSGYVGAYPYKNIDSFTASVAFKTTDATHLGIGFRADDADADDNNYAVILRNNSSTDTEVRVQKRVAGTQTYPVSAVNVTTDCDDGEWHTLTVSFNGSHIIVYVDNTKYIDEAWTDTSFTDPGLVGLAIYDGTTVFSDFSVIETKALLTELDDLYVNVTGDTMSGQLVVDYEGYQIKLVDGSSDNTAEFVASNNSLAFFSDRSDSIADSDIFFSIDNDTKMYIDTNGNVGIGTTSPSAKLHVNGNVLIGTNGLDESDTPPADFADLHIHTLADGQPIAQDDAASFVISTGANNTGVQGWNGTLWFGNSDYPAAGNINNSSGDQFNWKLAGIGSYAETDTGSSNVGSGDLRFFTTSDAASPTERMIITRGGNVGIGNTNPSNYSSDANNLVIGSLSGDNGITILSGSQSGYGSIYFADSTVGDKVKAGFIRYQQNVSDMTFGTNEVERMRLTLEGYLGIGTTDPGNLLHIQSASSGFSGTYDSRYKSIVEADGEAYYATYVPDNSFSGIRFNNTSGLRAYIDYYHGTQGEYFLYSSQDSHRFTIGTSEKLRIASNGSLDFKAYGAGGFKGDATYVLGVDSSGNVVETTTAGVYFGTNTSNGTYTNQWQRVLVIDTTNFDSQGFRLRIEGTGNTSGQSIVAEIEFNYKNQSGAIRARTTVNSYGTHPVDKDDVAVYFDTTNLEATFYFKVTQNYTAPIYSIVSGRIRNYAFYSNVIGDDTALASETNDSITSNLKFQGITQDQDSGNVGIGTSNPDNKLMVQGASTDGASSTGNVALFEGPAGTNGLKVFVDDTENAAGLQTISGDDLLINPHGGNVGIGTTSPNTFLHIAGQGNRAGGQIYLGNQDDGSTKYSLITSAHYNAATEPEGFTLITGLSIATENIVSIGGNVWESNPATNVRFYTHNATTHANGGSERMRIDGSGNVGIGTTDPDSILHIGAGDVPSTVLDGVLLTLSGDGQYYQASDGTKNIFMGVDSSSYGIVGMLTNHDLGFRTNNTEQLRIKTDGTIQFKSYGAGFLQTDANGNITAGSVTTSDTLDDVTDNGNSTTNSITVGGVTSTAGGEMGGDDLFFKNGGNDGTGTHIGNVWYSVSNGSGAAPIGVYESAVIKTVNSGTHGRADLVFKTKNNSTANFGTTSEWMRITKAGLIGINETNPLYGRLQVTQSVNNDEAGIGVLSASAGRSMRLWVDETVSYISSGDSGAGILSLNPGGGNVGIGEANPASLLHLGNNTNGTNIISFGEASVGGPHGLDFYGDDATRTKKFSIYYRTGTENISMEDGSGTKRWEITQSGAVTFNQAFTFPTADGSAGAALVTDGSGSLSWNGGYKQYSPVGWNFTNGLTYTATGQNIQSSATQILAGTTPVQRNSATEFQATKAGWYEIKYCIVVKNNYANRAMIGAYMTTAHGSGGGIINGSYSTQYVRFNTYGEYAQIQNSYFVYAPDTITKFYLFSYLLSGSMNMTTQALNRNVISFRYINNDIT